MDLRESRPTSLFICCGIITIVKKMPNITTTLPHMVVGWKSP